MSYLRSLRSGLNIEDILKTVTTSEIVEVLLPETWVDEALKDMGYRGEEISRVKSNVMKCRRVGDNLLACAVAWKEENRSVINTYTLMVYTKILNEIIVKLLK